MKNSYVAAGILTLVLGLWMASGALSSESEEVSDTDAAQEDSSTAPMKVEYIDITLTPKSRDVVLQGQLEPLKHLQLRAETGSIVETIAVDKGLFVNKGDTIVTLALQARESDLREAQARLQYSRSQEKAAASLRQQGLQSQERLETTQAELATARAQLDRVQRDISYTKISAPFSGVLNALPVEIGQMIDRGDVIAQLVDNSGFTVSAQVAQQTLSQLEVGKPIEVKLITGETLPGKLTFISSVADASSRSFTVEAEVSNEEGKYAAGVSASLVVPVEQVEAVFISPSALSLGDDGGLGVKTINDDQQVVFTPIELISSSLDGAWVTGIPDNSRVITLGQGFVKPGQEVDPVKAVKDTEEAS